MADDKSTSRAQQRTEEQRAAQEDPGVATTRAQAQTDDAVKAATEGDPHQHEDFKTGLVPTDALQKMEERAALGIPEPPKPAPGTKLIDAGAGTYAVIQEEMDPADVGPGTVLGHHDPRRLSDAGK